MSSAIAFGDVVANKLLRILSTQKDKTPATFLIDCQRTDSNLIQIYTLIIPDPQLNP